MWYRFSGLAGIITYVRDVHLVGCGISRNVVTDGHRVHRYLQHTKHIGHNHLLCVDHNGKPRLYECEVSGSRHYLSNTRCAYKHQWFAMRYRYRYPCSFKHDSRYNSMVQQFLGRNLVADRQHHDAFYLRYAQHYLDYQLLGGV